MFLRRKSKSEEPGVVGQNHFFHQFQRILFIGVYKSNFLDFLPAVKNYLSNDGRGCHDSNTDKDGHKL